MECDCKQIISDKLLERFKEQHPGSTDHRLDLGGYALVFGDTLESVPYLPVTTEHTVTAKTGRKMTKKDSFNMLANYCPFCGMKVKKETA
ncbi:hypothetical protein [Paludibacterium paludis]|uniref:Uncharacterized protein n=1 Tax=Paludibacterium paludis TaxID=1225769 RepID=A0A918NX60_9NEIS|nr:hypothetical protein [Paludibacterium paludis]GGY03631.1 hypothetical protein GCM10011289_02460 [Paludibacterium paludis]